MAGIETSHPSRVRGLKYRDDLLCGAPVLSHPSRVRGLKYAQRIREDLLVRSHPSRVRGLKLRLGHRRYDRGHVAPFTGAWIEITSVTRPPVAPYVAPFTGAWIEILVGPSPTKRSPVVAPFTGAWIEICSTHTGRPTG